MQVWLVALLVGALSLSIVPAFAQYSINEEEAGKVLDTVKEQGLPIVKNLSGMLHEIINHAIKAFIPIEIPEAVTTGIVAIVASLLIWKFVSKIANHGGRVVFVIVLGIVLIVMFVPALSSSA